MSVYDLGRALLEQREAMRVERDEARRRAKNHKEMGRRGIRIAKTRWIETGKLYAATKAERDEAIRQRDEARAVLAPLLDELATTGVTCPFCDGPRPPAYEHAPDCPVTRRDELLGRDQA